MLIDTHCHLEMMIQYVSFPQFTNENIQTVKKILNEAAIQSITEVITIGTTYQRSIQGIELATTFDCVYATVGIHPCDITENWRGELNVLEKAYLASQHDKIVGIGETGLDFYHPGFNKEQQKTVFRAQIELALKYDVALVVHSRNAIDETLAILQEYKNHPLKAVIHCFSEQIDIARAIIDLGFMVGIGGIITYPKNEYLRELLKTYGLKNIVLETDAPFLPPQHIRGKQNSPAQVRTIADYCAQLLGITIEQVAKETTDNAHQLFRI